MFNRFVEGKEKKNLLWSYYKCQSFLIGYEVVLAQLEAHRPIHQRNGERSALRAPTPRSPNIDVQRNFYRLRRPYYLSYGHRYYTTRRRDGLPATRTPQEEARSREKFRCPPESALAQGCTPHLTAALSAFGCLKRVTLMHVRKIYLGVN